MTIEYDPNRSANISLIQYIDGEKRYILSPVDFKVDDEIVSGEKAPQDRKLSSFENIPAGLVVHNIEMLPRKGGQLVRSAGSSAQVMAHSSGKCTLKLPSGEIRMVDDKCLATIGQVVKFMSKLFGKVGRTRWLGRRPKVRGVAMNPVDHPKVVERVIIGR